MDDKNPSEKPQDLVPRPRRRQCNGAQLGNKRFEVERMLLEGEPKLKIARALKISPGSVRAVSRQMGGDSYARPCGNPATSATTEPSSKSFPGRLRATAMRAVDAITDEKLGNTSAQGLSKVADTLLHRADALEANTGQGNLMDGLMKQFGIQPSSSVSRVVMTERKVEVAIEGWRQSNLLPTNKRA